MRSTYWDCIKGLAIIAVVVIHACGSSFTEFPAGSFNWIFGITLRQIINFAVPVFFVLSGLFSHPRKGVSARLFVFNRFVRILPPYIIWTLISILLNKPSDLLNPISLMKDFVLGWGIGIGYFVIVLLQFVVLTPLIWKIKKVYAHIVIMTILSILGLSATYALRIFFASRSFSSFPYNVILFLFWYPFFHLGVFVSMFRKEMDVWLNKIRKFIPGLLLLLFLLSLVEGFFWASRGFASIGASQVKASSFLLSVVLFLAVLSFKQVFSLVNKAVIAWLGRASFLIYLSHLLVLGRVVRVLRKADVLLHPHAVLFQLQPVFILLVSFFTLVLCAMFILIIEHTPARRVKRYLGL